MRTHRISVTVGADSIQVTPDPLVMTSKDEVSWQSGDQRRFSIVFDGPGPFAARELGHDVATRNQQPRAKGRFKYSVVSEERPEVKLDPVIIIEDPPTGTR